MYDVCVSSYFYQAACAFLFLDSKAFFGVTRSSCCPLKNVYLIGVLEDHLKLINSMSSGIKNSLTHALLNFMTEPCRTHAHQFRLG